ncbi:OLC1v1018634C1 [Oldenlandia corymbosa var. corymbosa]|uniref:OLC1v1018634C1 n=1 Tax=Oldenlandia corymbosa var. corymbosa TaxID=529605 RepID=A0AAV1EC18_OLDCO|nr:OLC1v1018634C1 [Oldenlandia corymbosa var. corymbosa]
MSLSPSSSLTTFPSDALQLPPYTSEKSFSIQEEPLKILFSSLIQSVQRKSLLLFKGSMAPRIKHTTKKRTFQIQGIGFPWVQPAIPPLPIPDSENTREERDEVRRRLHEPRDWNFFLTNLAWEFFKKNRNREAIIECHLINEGNPSTYIEDKGWEDLCDPIFRPRLVVVQEFYKNLAGVQGERRYIFVHGYSMEVSTEVIMEVLGLLEFNNDCEYEVANLHKKKDIWDSIKKVLCNNQKTFNWTPVVTPNNSLLSTPRINTEDGSTWSARTSSQQNLASMSPLTEH